LDLPGRAEQVEHGSSVLQTPEDPASPVRMRATPCSARQVRSWRNRPVRAGLRRRD